MNSRHPTSSVRCVRHAALAVLLALGSGCPSNPPPPASGPTAGTTTPATSTSASRGKGRREFDREAVRPQVEAFCGGCHAVPVAGSFPKKAWPEEVNRGFNIFLGSGRGDLIMPPVSDVVEYFRSQAPDQLEFPPAPSPPDSSPFDFRAEPFIPDNPQEVPGVAYIAFQSFPSPVGPQLLTCDMASGRIEARPCPGQPGPPLLLARAPQPCHIEPVDFDGDGRLEFVTASLGSYQPGDHDRGQVLWLDSHWDGSAQPAPVVLQDKLGRVADVRPADFDGDGDIDLVVGEFGFIKTGRILLLRNQGGDQKPPRFELETLDSRHGTIHVPVCDLNSDGRPDFIACISQDQETVVAFLNQGEGRFETQTLFAAGDPAYGSNGIQLIDFDQDGDLDVLYTNGDTLDSKFLKPYHGIQWLENRGEFPFTRHVIDAMPGVSRGLAGDLDGDGDLDVFAIAFFPANLRKLEGAPELASAVILENRGEGRFLRHRLETGNLEHMCLDLADVDADGDLDALIGHCASNPLDNPVGKPYLTLWRNHSPRAQATAGGAARPTGDEKPVR